MNRKVIQTADGSSSIEWTDKEETYHSRHGAIQESEHVFLKMGYDQMPKDQALAILEIGWGTGLNSLLTLNHKEADRKISYCTIEAYPLELEHVRSLDYCSGALSSFKDVFLTLHENVWGTPFDVEPHFTFLKLKTTLQEVELEDSQFDLVYFDAFGPRTQPELWEPWVWTKLFTSMKPKGVLVTYCAKGQVRRDMQSAGFTVERLPGAPGKREMLRATKIAP